MQGVPTLKAKDIYLSLIFFSFSGSLEESRVFSLSCPSLVLPEGTISTVIMTLSDKELPSAAGTEKCRRELGSMPEIPEFLLLKRVSAIVAAAELLLEEADDREELLAVAGPGTLTCTSSNEESSCDALLKGLCILLVSEVEDALAVSSLPSRLLLENSGVHLFLKEEGSHEPEVLVSESSDL